MVNPHGRVNAAPCADWGGYEVKGYGLALLVVYLPRDWYTGIDGCDGDDDDDDDDEEEEVEEEEKEEK